MRVILDTNVLLSALMTQGSSPARLFEHWKARRFDLVSCETQLEEINRVTRRPFFRERIRGSEAGRLVNHVRALAVMVDAHGGLRLSPDPADDYLLIAATAGQVDYLVTGDKSDLLALRRYETTQLVTARFLADLLDR
ncbi:MAG: putative toxin-antitoxin system toxin component, PIN family [Burkholderiales bacterium]